MMNLNELRDKAYKIACEHGFHDEEHNNEHWLMLVITELAEAVEYDRKGLYITALIKKEYMSYQLDGYKPAIFDLYIKETVDAELADAFIRLLDFAGLRGFNLNRVLIHAPNFKGTFIENIFKISSEITYYKYSMEERVNFALLSIKKICDIMNIDLEWVVKEKMKYNSMREYKHGKKY